MDRVYYQFVRPALQDILLAPKEKLSLSERVETILNRSFSMQDREFPRPALAAWKKIHLVKRHQLSMRMQQLFAEKLIGKTCAVSRSLTPTECKAVINAFLDVAECVIRQRGAKEVA